MNFRRFQSMQRSQSNNRSVEFHAIECYVFVCVSTLSHHLWDRSWQNVLFFSSLADDFDKTFASLHAGISAKTQLTCEWVNRCFALWHSCVHVYICCAWLIIWLRAASACCKPAHLQQVSSRFRCVFFSRTCALGFCNNWTVFIQFCTKLSTESHCLMMAHNTAYVTRLSIVCSVQ